MLSGVFACDDAELKGAEADVKPTSVKLDLPAVPEFNVPQPNADGTHAVAEMRLRGNRYLGTEVKVKGHIIWVYDCATSVRTADMTEEQLKTLLTEQPELCARPNFYLGDTAQTAADRGIWIVDIPRPPREDEKKALDDVARKEMEAAAAMVPPFKLGDQVVVTGMWELTSPLGFKNSNGLLIFKAMENLTTPSAPPEGAAATPTPPPEQRVKSPEELTKNQ